MLIHSYLVARPWTKLETSQKWRLLIQQFLPNVSSFYATAHQTHNTNDDMLPSCYRQLPLQRHRPRQWPPCLHGALPMHRDSLSSYGTLCDRPFTPTIFLMFEFYVSWFQKISCCFEFKSPRPLSAVYDGDVRVAHTRQSRCHCLFWRISFSSTNNTINKIGVSPTNLFHLTKYDRGCFRKDAHGASGVRWHGVGD